MIEKTINCFTLDRAMSGFERRWNEIFVNANFGVESKKWKIAVKFVDLNYVQANSR